MNPLKKILLLFVQLFFVVPFLLAQDKYRLVHWGVDEGLSGSHNALLKDVNGFLWIGTTNGLNRFDGSNFKNYIPDKNKRGSVIDGGITNLIEDSLHNIWVGTRIGLSRYDIKADTFSNFQATQPVYKFVIPFWATENEVYCLEGGWSLTAYNIHSFKKKLLAMISPPEYVGGDDESYHSFFDAQSNSLWVPKSYLEGQSIAGLFEVSLTTGKRNFYTWPCFKNIPGHIHRIKDMRYDRKRNVVWISSTDGLLEFTLNDKQFHRVDVLKEISNPKDFIYPEGVDLDSQGRIWWCSFPRGPIIYDPPTQSFINVFSDLRKQRQIASDNLYIYCDRDGMVWTSSGGIYQIIPASLPIIHYTGDTSQLHHLFNGTAINRIAIAGHGKLWIGVGDELNVYDIQSGSFQLISSEKDLPVFSHKLISPVSVDTIHQKALFDIWDQTKQVSSLYEMDIATKKCRLVIFKDSTGRTVDPPLGYRIFSYKNDAILFSDVINKESSVAMFVINTDSALARWIAPLVNNFDRFATNNDRLFFIKGDNNITYSWLNDKLTRIKSPIDSMAWTAIYYNEKDKTYWVGSGDSLIHYTKDFGVINSYYIKGIAFGDGIIDVLPDNRSHIWIQFNRTISWLNIETGKITPLSEKDGFIKRGLAEGTVMTDGDLYFWGGGLDRLNPDKLMESYPPSFAYFKSLEINQKPFSLSTGINDVQELSLRYNQNKISIETGIIDYYTKGGSSIRYKLKGLSEKWQIAPADYTIRYDVLPPAKYTLEIEASNAGGDFNGPKKILVINISPPFWQTWWFRISMGILVLLIFYGIYRWRTATLRKQKRILEQTVKERTAEVVEEKAQIEKQKDVIQKEKERSDELLLNILPSEVAEELKEKGYTTAKSFDEVTILFSDIKGFTHVAERMTAQELVKEIDTYFSAFDHIMQLYGLEKIKTIGDAYIAAGGLPEGNSANASKVVDAAIAMQNAVENFKKERIEKDLPHFELRIGIHTGPVVAGVVGIKKFQYDIWGDTVNMAARMEQSGVPGKINISQYTYDKVKDQFICTHRGKIEAKNKGDVDMYFVEMKIL